MRKCRAYNEEGCSKSNCEYRHEKSITGSLSEFVTPCLNYHYNTLAKCSRGDGCVYKHTKTGNEERYLNYLASLRKLPSERESNLSTTREFVDNRHVKRMFITESSRGEWKYVTEFSVVLKDGDIVRPMIVWPLPRKYKELEYEIVNVKKPLSVKELTNKWKRTKKISIDDLLN